MEENVTFNLSLNQLAEKAGLSRFHLEKIFNSELGLPIKKYFDILRINHSANALRSCKEISITDLCFELGFNDLSNFIRKFKKIIGCPPHKYRNCSHNPDTCKLRKSSLTFYGTDKNINIILPYQSSNICLINRVIASKRNKTS